MFVTIEIQKLDGNLHVTTVTKETAKEAKAEAWTRAGYAAIGTAEKETILCIDEDGAALLPTINI